MTRYCQSLIAALITASALLVPSLPVGAAWDHAHGDSANTGFARVITAPALKPHQTIPLGTLAPGAGPVIGPTGMLYVGTMHGKVLAFQPDGTPAWTKLLPLGDPFLASPVVDAEGAVYLASTLKDEGPAKGGGTVTRYQSTLHKLSGDTGAFFWSVPLPLVGPDRSTRDAGGPVAAAPPSIWRSGSLEVVVLPVVYNYPGGVELRLLAFAPQNGALLGNTLVSSKQYEVEESGWEDWFKDWNWSNWACVLEFGAASVLGPCRLRFHSPTECGNPCLEALWPMPGVAITPDRRGSLLVIVSSDLSQDTVGYRFDPASGFAEAFRIHDAARSKTSTPTGLPDGHVVMGTQDKDGDRGRLTFPGPTPPPVADRPHLFGIAAAPTRLQDGKVAVMMLPGSMVVFRANTNTIFGRFKLSGESIASVAASCTHLFAASDGAFTTFDVKTLRQVAQVPWSGGGRFSPVIGPAGHVYGVMHAVDQTDFLFVWMPSSAQVAASGVRTPPACDPVVVHK